jgi:hypothetical protein
MATSGTEIYSYDAREIITQAARKAGLIKYDSPNPPTSIVKPYLRTLNMLVAQWETKGLHLWKNARIRITPVAYRATYKFGALADAAQEIKYESHTIAAQSSADTTIDVASSSATDMIADDPIDIYLSDGTIHSTTISGSPSSITGGYRVTLTDALDGDLDDGARVLTWKTCTRLPIAIRDAGTQTTDSTTIVPIDVLSFSDFKEIVDPRSGGEAQRVALEKTLSGSMLHVWPEPADSNTFVILECAMRMEGFDTLDDDPDMPSAWYMALIYELARIMMDDNPEKQYPDAHRLNVIRGAKERLDAAADLYWEPERHQVEVNMGIYED